MNTTKNEIIAIRPIVISISNINLVRSTTLDGGECFGKSMDLIPSVPLLLEIWIASTGNDSNDDGNGGDDSDDLRLDFDDNSNDEDISSKDNKE